MAKDKTEPQLVTRFYFVGIADDCRAVVQRLEGTYRDDGMFVLPAGKDGDTTAFQAELVFETSEAATREAATRARANVQEALKRANEMTKASAAVHAAIDLPPHVRL